MKFERGRLYRHKDTTDIDIYVLGECFHVGDRFACKVMYFNRHYKIFQGRSEYVRIRYVDLKNWKEIANVN